MATDPDLAALATEAYVFAYPLVFDLDEVNRFTKEGLGALPAADWNTFSHATALAGPGDRFVSVNNDTIYSIAQLDVSNGPVVLSVPDTADRYYVLQFVDAWTNNFAYVGRRATGTAAGTFVIVPPGWQGDVPAAATRIESPTPIATIVGRWACAGEDDLAVVRTLQEQLTLQPLAGNGPPPTGLAEIEPGATDAATFFAKARAWIEHCPPSSNDEAILQRFAPLGLAGDEPPPAEIAAALEAGYAAGRLRVESASRSGGGAGEWNLNLHVFDYNDSFFEVGTLSDPAWVIQDRPTALLTRAIAARVGLWGNHGYEAGYAQVFDDSDGTALSGDRRYVLRFDEPPPVDAFWSVTMYDVPDYYLVANPVGRYSIGDRTPGLRYGDDGSLTIVLQHDEPDDTANWLPTPAGPFRPMLRLYQPGAAILDGTYRIPPITAV